MKKLAYISLMSLILGTAAHLIFYPIIEGFSNRRMQRLVRPAVGVMVNMLPFTYAISQVTNDLTLIMMTTFIYIYTFVWNGAGVVIGYIFGDIVDKNADSSWE